MLANVSPHHFSLIVPYLTVSYAPTWQLSEDTDPLLLFLLLDLSEHHLLVKWPSHQLLHAKGDKPVCRKASDLEPK